VNTLIVKLNATGDVVRTTPLLHRLDGTVTWLTAARNRILLDGLRAGLRCVTWEDRASVLESSYDLVLNLEDEAEVAHFVRDVHHARLFGAHLGSDGGMTYTPDARGWFDMSLISAYGPAQADQLKYRNRRSYQELLFEGLGLRFEGEEYLLPNGVETGLTGDVAIAAAVGPVWPMKNWVHYDRLAADLRTAGCQVNFLPIRVSLLEHIGDIRGHRCLVGGDSLPMHIALGQGLRCVTIFNCTSPWEIYDYGRQTKIVSPLLGQYFYMRGNDARATTAVAFDEVFKAVVGCIAAPQLLNK